MIQFEGIDRESGRKWMSSSFTISPEELKARKPGDFVKAMNAYFDQYAKNIKESFEGLAFAKNMGINRLLTWDQWRGEYGPTWDLSGDEMSKYYRKRNDCHQQQRVILTPETMERKLETNQAVPITLDRERRKSNPAIEALGSVERDIFLLRSQGHKLREIGEMVGLKEFQVCRILQDIQKKFEYLLQFREVIFKHENMLAKFLTKQVEWTSGKSRENCLEAEEDA